MSYNSIGAGGGRNVAPVYVVRAGELMLDAPIEEAWLHVSNYWTWNNFSLRQHISGEPGREGEVVLLKKEEGVVFPPYYTRTIKLDPGRRVVTKGYFEPGTAEVDFSGFVDFSVREEGAKTRFCYSVIYEFMVPYESESQLDDFRKQQYANFDVMFSSVVPKLKALCQPRKVAGP